MSLEPEERDGQHTLDLKYIAETASDTSIWIGTCQMQALQTLVITSVSFTSGTYLTDGVTFETPNRAF